MNFSTITLYVLALVSTTCLEFTNAISVSSNVERDESEGEYFANHTERQKRLIPYMTFYIPTGNEYQQPPPNQQYTLMPLQKIQQMKHILAIVKQQQPPQQGGGQLLPTTGPTGGTAPSQPHRPMPFSNPAKYHQNYQEPRPQLTLLYNIRNPSSAPKHHHQPHQYMTHQNYHNSENQFLQQPHSHQKTKITPFLPSNKLPGYFTPMISNTPGKNTKNFNSDPIVTFTVQPQVNQFPTTTLRPIYAGGEEQERQKYVTFLSPQNLYTVLKSTASPTLTTPAINYHDENDLDTRDGPFSHQEHRTSAMYPTESPVVKQNIVYITQQKPKQHLVTHKGNYGGFIPVAVTATSTTAHPPTPTPTIHISPTGKTFLKTTKATFIHEPPSAPSGRAQDYDISSTQTPPRQHLTETTQNRPPHLTTYHPTFIHHHKYPQNEPKKIYESYHQEEYLPSSPAPPRLPIRTTARPIITKNDFQSKSLTELLKKLQDSNQLPQTLTSENIDNSIRTLIKILNNLKQEQNVAVEPAQHQDDGHQDYDDDDYNEEPRPEDEELVGPNSGRAGIDFPNLSEIPQTSFSCKEQRYKGFFGDPETNCQVWHYCDLNGGQASFLCPNGTIFSQVALTCDWWFNVKCSTTPQLYVLNERLYKYILPFTPKFPEDYSGPLVDKYLAIKFQEMEDKMRKQKKGKQPSEMDADSITGGEDSMDSDIDTGTVDESENETEDETHQPIPYTSTIMAAKPTPATVTIIPAPHKMRTIVESERAEVVEIKSDGSSGHLLPSHSYP